MVTEHTHALIISHQSQLFNGDQLYNSSHQDCRRRPGLVFSTTEIKAFLSQFPSLKSFSAWTEQFVKQTCQSLIKGSPCVHPSTLTELFKIQHAWQDWSVKNINIWWAGQALWSYLVGESYVHGSILLTYILFWRCVRCIMGNWRKVTAAAGRTHLGRKEKQDSVFWLVCGKESWKDDRKKVKRKIEGIKCNYNVIMNSTSRD